MKDTERLQENLKEILTEVKNHIWNYEDNWRKEHQEEYYKATGEDKRMIEAIYQDIMKGTKKSLKKLGEVKEFLENWLYN